MRSRWRLGTQLEAGIVVGGVAAGVCYYVAFMEKASPAQNEGNGPASSRR